MTTGGTIPFTYAWNTVPAQNTTNLIALKAGLYSVTVTDSLLCTDTAKVLLTEPNHLALSLDSVSHVSCHGGNDGSLFIGASGGTPAYSYMWSTGSATEDLGFLVSGYYGVTVTDIKGCRDSLKTFVKEPDPLVSSAVSMMMVSCHGGSDAMVYCQSTGGTMPVDFVWSNGSADVLVTGLSAGSYGVTATDSMGCTDSSSVVVTEPAVLQLSALVSDVRCFGDSNGGIVLEGIGGTQPYVFTWSTPLGNDTIASGLEMGDYTVIVTDSRYCTDTLQLVVKQPSPLTSAVDSVNHVDCFGYSDGALAVSGSGGTYPYVYAWNDDANADSVRTGLSSGQYVFSITDSNGCVVYDSTSITQPMDVVSNAYGDTTICIGQAAYIAVKTEGGNGPYVYQWNEGLDGSSTHQVLPVATKWFTVQTIDKNGCFGNADTVKVFVLDPLKVIATAADSVCRRDSIVLDAVATGGDGNHGFWWDPIGAVNSGQVKLIADSSTYFVVHVRDGCATPQATDTVFVKVLPRPDVLIMTDTSKGCMPLTVFFSARLTPYVPSRLFWDFGDGNVSAVDSIEHTYTFPGSYQPYLHIRTTSGCEQKTALPGQIDVYRGPQAAFISSPERATLIDPLISFVNTSVYSDRWSWFFGDGTTADMENPFHTYADTGDFRVTLIAENVFGCSDTTQGSIYIEGDFSIYIPNAFTPDDDGINDMFRGYGTGISKYEMTIIDRWGTHIFETADYEKPWDGKLEDSLCQQDTYVYVIRVWDLAGREHAYHGRVTLVR
jgi:gliding motility-associated-like protein